MAPDQGLIGRFLPIITGRYRSATALPRPAPPLRLPPTSLTKLSGLEELGHAMDVEMAAVPTNCREDDDVQSTSEVIAL